MDKQVSPRELAKSWPFETHLDFEKRLRNAASQWFKHKGYETQKCGYILAKYDNWHENIICQKVADYIKSERDKRANNRQGFPLHKYIHHGLSSQAMLFNLVGPLIMREPQELEPIKSAFQKHGIKWPKGKLVAKFEDEDRGIFNEMTQKPTSIDLVIESEGKVGGLYIEFKFVEHEFGGCSVFKNGDCDGRNPVRNLHSCYLHHIGRKYWNLLNRYGFLKGSIAENATCFLATYYQFFREVLYALERNGVFVLLVDKRNPTFCSGENGRRGLFPFLKGFVPTELKDKVYKVTVQEVVTAIKESGEYSWIAEFEQKYGIE
jgi:POLQ-like helicase